MSLFNLFKKKFTPAKEVLAKAPGPSPWYLLSAGPELTSSHGALVWFPAGDDEISTGKVLLTTSNGEAIAIFDFYCYVLPMKHNRFLVWYEEKEQLGSTPATQSFIELLILDADKLGVIGDTQAAFEEMKARGIKVFQRNGEVSSFRIQTSMNEGQHELKLPDAFSELDEILVLAHSTAGNLCLFIVKPKEESLEIIPQDWFNKGPYDFGYQWPTRVARDPETGQIFGEGIRLGVFVLDNSLRQVLKWLHTDHFYHPER
ncbi:MAG TPA: hypothetical protein VGX92_03670 [Pyrinomonadaceae bacterium]|jgi:hypothetical protein|nr:hypothetical protein [Pyrinomonadaceae bacterium]